MVLDEKIGKEVSKVVDKNTKLIILRNHGNIIIADSLEELQHLTFHFENAVNTKSNEFYMILTQ